MPSSDKAADSRSNRRLEGLDVARFLAFAGMVVVNFKVVMGGTGGPAWLQQSTTLLEGKAAASFVVLAGVGLGLAYARDNENQMVVVTLRRAAFLLVAGLLNSLIFDADILHYYAFYFLIGVVMLRLDTKALLATILLLNVAFVIMAVTLEYDTGWNWVDYSYADFWTPAGFVRNLFFNGWHPVIPWLGFLLFGVILSRLQLNHRRTQRSLAVFGAATLLAVEGLSFALVKALAPIDPELTYLVHTSPVPPFPLYTIAGISAASLLIGICLRLQTLLARTGVTRLLAPAGRQTLTLYIAHIIVGMGTLDAFGLLGNQSLVAAVSAALLFSLASLVYALLWSRQFKRGPIEALMRRVAG